MIVYDKEQKEIVIPNGIGNINLFNNGVEAGYNQGYEQGQADMAGKARVLNVTENGVYKSKYSDPIIPTVTGVYADGTDFYSYAELTNKVFNTKIAGSVDSRLEFWYKGDNIGKSDGWDIIIGSGDFEGSRCFIVRYFAFNNDKLCIEGTSREFVLDWDDTVWHHLIISKEEGIWVDGKKVWDFSPSIYLEGEFFINGISYNTERNANGYFGMIKIDDTIIIPTADGFLNTNTGELLEVVKDGGYTFTENKIIYGEGELYKTINVNVPDLNGSYDEGYAQGKTDGINEQKSKLESINITENGTYRKEDGYNEVVVNVADLNGDYNEGYEQGQADVAANARVLNVTENGVYKSKYSDPIIPTVTGVYADGTDFYNCAELTNKVFNTKIAGSVDSRLEFWYKGDNQKSGDAWDVMIGSGNNDDDNCFQVRYLGSSNDTLYIGVGNSYISVNSWDDTVWHHLIVSKSEGLWIDGEKKGDFTPFNTINGEFFINGIGYSNTRNANGCFGMIKIDDVIIIPTANGFLNTNTGELLEVVKNGGYTFTENKIIYGEGELYKTINVNVLPKINVQKTGLRLGYSIFTEVPEWVDFEGITNMESMFNACSNLQTIPLIDTSNVTNMFNMFNFCGNLRTIPQLNTSNVTSMKSMFYNCSNLQTIPLLNTSNVTNMEQMFGDCRNLQTIPSLDTSKVTDMYAMFSGCNSLVSLPALDARSLNIPSYYGIFGYSDLPNITDFGGFLNLKSSLTNDSNLKRLPNLTKESCINVLNGLYDFTGNGETPNGGQGQLKVAQSFIDKVGDEISIGINKGWQITA